MPVAGACFYERVGQPARRWSTQNTPPNTHTARQRPLTRQLVGASRSFAHLQILYANTVQTAQHEFMNNPHSKTEWLAQWHRYLDDHETRMACPEAYRRICLALSKDMADAQIIDQAEKLEMDELVNAAYWHAVETLIDCEPEFLSSGFYDVLPQHGGPCIGKLNGRVYYPDAVPGSWGQWAAQVVDEKGARRLVFRISAEAWAMNGLTLTRPDGSLYDLVLTGQRIRGKEYSNIDDPDSFRALADTAQIALENHDFETYQRARPLLVAAAFTKCTSCMDSFALREECPSCGGRGFISRTRAN